MRRLVALGLVLLLTPGCSLFLVRRPHPSYDANLEPRCGKGYQWPLVDASMAGLGVPAITVGTLVAMDQSCRASFPECQPGDRALPSAITAIVGLVAVAMFVASNRTGMQRVTQCKVETVRWRFANAPPAGTGPPGGDPGLAPGSEPPAPTTPGATTPTAGTAATAGGSTPTPGSPPTPGATSAPPTDLDAPREVHFHDSALDDLARLEGGTRDLVRARARSLADRPRPAGARPLTDPWEGRYGLPVVEWDLVIVYRIADDVLVEAVLPSAALPPPPPEPEPDPATSDELPAPLPEPLPVEAPDDGEWVPPPIERVDP